MGGRVRLKCGRYGRLKNVVAVAVESLRRGPIHSHCVFRFLTPDGCPNVSSSVCNLLAQGFLTRIGRKHKRKRAGERCERKAALCVYLKIIYGFRTGSEICDLAVYSVEPFGERLQLPLSSGRFYLYRVLARGKRTQRIRRSFDKIFLIQQPGINEYNIRHFSRNLNSPLCAHIYRSN